MKQILKQTSWLILAQILTRAIGFFYTIFLARNLGVEEFGLFSVALTYFALASTFSDFGFNRFLIREVARDHLKAPQLICSISLLRLTFTAVLFALFGLGLYLIDTDKMRVYLSLLAVMAVLPLSVSQTLDGIFVAFQKLQYSGLGFLGLSISNFLFGIWLVGRGFGSTGAVIALILAQMVYLLSLFIILNRQKVPFLSSISEAMLKKITFGAIPYGVLAVLGLIYFRVDILMLAYLRGNFEAGLYGASYKFLEAIIFIPSALATALFPTLARLHEVSSKKINQLYFNSIKVMAFLGVLITVAFLVVVPTVVKLFLPNYTSSINAIKILSLSIPFIFVHVPGAQVLLSTDKYLKEVLKLSVFTLSFNVLLNLIFIPQYGLLAAAWVTVASEVLTLVVFFRLLQNRVLNNK